MLKELNKLEWLEPWRLDSSGLEAELAREVSSGHPLFGVTAIAVARGDGDDVLFYLSGHPSPLAVVHLTWRKESGALFPHTCFYDSVEDFVERCMKPDHKDYNEIMGEGG